LIAARQVPPVPAAGIFRLSGTISDTWRYQMFRFGGRGMSLHYHHHREGNPDVVATAVVALIVVLAITFGTMY
jgi:hypothetical protein